MNLNVASIGGALAQTTPLTLGETGLVGAGVMLLLYPRNGEVCVLLNKRTQLVEHHKGEISLPGGARDPGDATILDTALRETHEEMGISREDVVVLGRLDQVSTRSGFAITPFVGTIPESYSFKASRAEVAEVLEVPLSLLLNPVYRQESARIEGDGAIKTYSYAFGEHLIWGATARILTQFLGLITPVLR